MPTVNDQIKFLRIPLYMLEKHEDINDELLNNIANSLMQDYSEQDYYRIVQALKWAKNHPNFDFKQLDDEMNTENRELYQNLVAILELVEK